LLDFSLETWAKISMVFQITILISGLAFDGSTLNRIANSVLNPHPQWLLSPTAAAKDKTERK
jgi:hypothetical protein